MNNQYSLDSRAGNVRRSSRRLNRAALRSLLLLCGAASLSPLLQAEETWDFTLAPYLWFAGIEGDVATVPGLPVAPIKVSPSQALEDTEASFMMAFVANKGHHGVGVDFFYSDVQSDEEFVPQLDLMLKSTSKTTVASVHYHFALGQTGLKLYGGARYWKIDTELAFSGGLGILDGQTVRHKEDWVDPIVGIRGRYNFGDSPFFAGGILAAGGFGIGSELFIDLTGTIGYQWTPAIATSVGYRLYDLEYEEGDFFYDVRQEGWLLAFRWDF